MEPLADAPVPVWGLAMLDRLEQWIDTRPDGPDSSRPAIGALAVAMHLIDQLDEVLVLKGWPCPEMRFQALAQQAVGVELRHGDALLLVRIEPDGRWRLLQAEGEGFRDDAPAGGAPLPDLQQTRPWALVGEQPVTRFVPLVAWLGRLLASDALQR